MFKLLSLAVLCMAYSFHTQAVTFNGIASSFFQQKVHEGMSLLPDNFLDQTTGAIEFSEAPLPGDELMESDLCKLKEGIHFGITSFRKGQHKIQISSRLMKLANEVKKVFACSHGTFEKVLLATIVHELTHVKDNFEKISTDPDFQRMVGVRKITRSSKKKVMNQNVSASPDAYEFENLEEALAVNVEYMLLDKEFPCRKPATANFLAKKLGLKMNQDCRKNYKVVTQSAYLEDNYLHTLSLDPERIYQVHYLFAGKGEALMSRWGHAMFRLIVCAPHRKTVGPDCMRDVSHHVALSYRAYVTDLSISYSKGISGDYPSQLFIMRFHEVQQEYTKFELRDLYSVPLKLTSGQKREFINLTLERYWTYQGKYYFLDNNCGTETQKHLAFALTPEQSKLIGSFTPSKMYKDIVSTIAEGPVKGLSRAELIAKGILIPSLLKELDETYEGLKSSELYSEKTFKKFLKKTTAVDRLRIYQDFFATHKLGQESLKKLVMRLIYLERFLLSRFIMEVPKKAVEKMNKDASLKAEVMKMGESLKLLGVQPWQVVDSDYGVPTEDEFELQYPVFALKRTEAMQVSTEEQFKNLQNILGKQHFASELQELTSYQAIKNLTNELFLQINKQ